MTTSSQSVEIPSDISKDELLEAIVAIRKTREQKEVARIDVSSVGRINEFYKTEIDDERIIELEREPSALFTQFPKLTNSVPIQIDLLRL
ncbi:hypothetical protein WR25_01116 [Diploscapter pachys]|uniref:Uncharacterized protein n=1 Tax=Diploscapter pachys TaxID=2018661 RepID=A0A2A2LJF2_9BILA|nr:hypothetical protein WR25_01116 [Diploscapter pachys]